MKKLLILGAVFFSFAFIANAAVCNLNAGCTGLGTSTQGDLLVGTSSVQQYTRLPVGVNGTVLQSTGSTPRWVATSTLGLSKVYANTFIPFGNDTSNFSTSSALFWNGNLNVQSDLSVNNIDLVGTGGIVDVTSAGNSLIRYNDNTAEYQYANTIIQLDAVNSIYKFGESSIITTSGVVTVPLRAGIGTNNPDSAGKLTIASEIVAVGNPSDLNVSALNSGISNYISGDSLYYKIYAYKTDALGNKAYSVTPFTSSNLVIVNNYDQVDLSWTTVSGASGYLLKRDFNADGYASYKDVGNVTNVTDTKDTGAYFIWDVGTPSLPTSYQDNNHFNYISGSTRYGIYNTLHNLQTNNQTITDTSGGILAGLVVSKYNDTLGQPSDTPPRASNTVPPIYSHLTLYNGGSQTGFCFSFDMLTCTATWRSDSGGSNNIHSKSYIAFWPTEGTSDIYGTPGRPFTVNTYGVMAHADAAAVYLALNALDVNGASTIGAGYAGIETAPTNGLLVQGDTGFGTTTPSAKVAITGVVGTQNVLNVASSTQASMFVVKSSGNVGVNLLNPQVLLQASIPGTTAHTSLFTGNETFMGTSNTVNNLRLILSSNAATPPGVIMLKTRGTNLVPTIVANNDQAGILSFQTYDGTARFSAAQIIGEVDGTPGLNDMPGRMLFFTTPDGSTVSTERMRITNAGNVGIGSTTPSALLGIKGSGSTIPFTVASSTNAVLLTVLPNGNVGVSTSTPIGLFSIGASTATIGQINLASTTALTSTSLGDIWNDGTQNTLAFSNGNTLYQGGHLYTATADVTLNSTTPTTAFSSTRVGTTTIKANTLKVGQKFTVWGAGYYSTPLANTSTVTITNTMASSTAVTISTVTTAALPASAVNLPFEYALVCTIRSIGTAATAVCDGDFKYATALSAVAKTSNSLSTVGAFKFNSTVDQTFDTKVSWSAVTTQTATVQQSLLDF